MKAPKNNFNYGITVLYFILVWIQFQLLHK